MMSVPVASGKRGPRRSSSRAPIGMKTSMLTVDGQQQQAGGEGVVAAHLLEVQREHVHRAGERDVVDEVVDEGAVERAAPEEREVDAAARWTRRSMRTKAASRTTASDEGAASTGTELQPRVGPSLSA